jgi:hypothetical protein
MAVRDRFEDRFLHQGSGKEGAAFNSAPAGEGRITAEPAGTKGTESQRDLHAKEWAVVHAGPAVKCFKIAFTGWTDPKKEGGQPAIAVYVDGERDANLAKSLTIGNSTEVCGKSIRVYGLLRGAQVAHWQVSEDGVTDWFE